MLEVETRDVALRRRERQSERSMNPVSVSGDSDWCERSVPIVIVSHTPKFTQKYTSLASHAIQLVAVVQADRRARTELDA